MAIPTQLGGTVQTLVTPQTKLQEIERATPGLVAYAVKVVCHYFFFFLRVGFLKTVFRMSDILVRIRIRGFVPLPNGSDSGYCSLLSDLQDTHKKDFFPLVFLLNTV